MLLSIYRIFEPQNQCPLLLKMLLSIYRIFEPQNQSPLLLKMLFLSGAFSNRKTSAHFC